MKQVFNLLEFKKALKTSYSNPVESVNRLEKYLEDYPYDYSAYPYYASVLITIQELDKAEIILNKVNDLLHQKDYYLTKKERMEKVKENIVFSTLKLLIYKNKYQDAYEFCIKYYDLFGINIKYITLFLKGKLGLINKSNRDQNNYLKRQIMEYSEKDFLEHVERHEADYNMDLDTPNENIFVSEFDVKKIIDEIKKYIPSNKKLYSGFIEDIYIFKYNECGRINNKLCDYFKVVCFHDTTDFITMYSILDGEDLPYIDLNYLKEKDDSKIKKISQVDKFYKRYKFK